jgi:ABC-type transport system involved in multi-copper enzyme maturation permease subunit
MNSILVTFVYGSLLSLSQFLAALPWLAVADLKAFKAAARKPANWAIVVAVVLGVGAGLAVFIRVVQDPVRLMAWGRLYGGLLQVQLVVDFFAILFPLLVLVWPQGAAIALAAFREGVRQPLYWLIMAVVFGWMLLSPFLPYFTFGEDSKMVMDLGYGTIMLAGLIFGVLVASMSVSEEIEGRTAITVMSKPVSRRQFLLGKFAGILLAALLMTGVLGCIFNGVMWFKLWFDKETVGDPSWLEPTRLAFTGLLGSSVNFALGAGIWFDAAVGMLPGLILGFCQVTVLTAIAVALATRLPMIVNLVTCLIVFFLGNLTHVLVQGAYGRFKLVKFMANVFDNILPGLEYFDPTPIIVHDIAPNPARFSFYIGSVVLYAALYSIIALLFGLILFEDRDLA